MRRMARRVQTRLGPQEDVTAAAPRQGAPKRLRPHGETLGVGGGAEGLQGPGGGDELHGRFLHTSGWLHGILPSSWGGIYGVRATTRMRAVTANVLPFSRDNCGGGRTSRPAWCDQARQARPPAVRPQRSVSCRPRAAGSWARSPGHARQRGSVMREVCAGLPLLPPRWAWPCAAAFHCKRLRGRTAAYAGVALYRQRRTVYAQHIGKYLSSLGKLDNIVTPKEGFETQLCASCVPIPFGVCALGITRQIRDGRFQGGIEIRPIPALQGPPHVA